MITREHLRTCGARTVRGLTFAAMLAAALAAAGAAPAAGSSPPSTTAAAAAAPRTTAPGTTAASPAASRPAPATGGATATGASDLEDQRLRLLRRDIQTLKKSLETLSGREQGVLGELKALESDALRKQEELAHAEGRLASAVVREASLRTSSADLDARLVAMRSVIARRLSALYRLGRPRYARVLLASREPANFLSAYRAAAALSSRDAQLIAEYRHSSEGAKQERARLAAMRPVLDEERANTLRSAKEASAALERKRALLRAIQSDRRRNQSVLAELENAQRAAARLVSGLGDTRMPEIGFDRFRGLLDWPATGSVSSQFGQTVDRKFGTTLGHSGLDIDAPFGGAIRSVFEGTVVFAQWLRGYGLTVIVDHGGGWLSVYAHSSVLLVAKGEAVGRGRKIALVGDTGSLRGPYLYFEIRKDGHPVDPLGWLRTR